MPSLPRGQSVYPWFRLDGSFSSLLISSLKGESITAQLHHHDQGPGGTASQHGRQGGTSRPRPEEGATIADGERRVLLYTVGVLYLFLWPKYLSMYRFLAN